LEGLRPAYYPRYANTRTWGTLTEWRQPLQQLPFIASLTCPCKSLARDDKVNDGGIYLSSLCQFKNVPLTLSSRVFDWSPCLGEEADDFPGNYVRMVFEREVACLEQVELCLRNVAQICPCALDGEEGIILAPDD
jgi:hypothetical protein